MAREHNVNAFVSTSGGKFRVIYQGMPLSVDKPNVTEAIDAANRCGCREIASLAWDGDSAEWVSLDSFSK